MTLAEVIDDQFLAKYRALLDAEDAAFDELEHCCEDGNRAQFDDNLASWRDAVEQRLSFLHRRGVFGAPSLAV